MQYIKQKIANLYIGIAEKHKKKQLETRRIIRSLLKHPEIPIQTNTVDRLILLSADEKEYREAVRSLVQKLEEFDYQRIPIRTVAKAISIVLYLIKSRKESFAIDFHRHQSIFVKLQKVNTHYFHNEYTSHKKELEFCLQVIRQRATYIRRLFENLELLNQQRSKNKQIQVQVEMGSELCSPSQSTEKSFKVSFKRGSEQRVEQAVEHFQIKEVMQNERKSHKKDRNISFF